MTEHAAEPESPARPGRDDAAFEAYAGADRLRLVRLGWAMCGDLGVAEDVAHDVLVELFARWPSIDDPTAYARRALVNRFRSRWRRTASERKATERLAARASTPVLLPEPSAEVWRAVRNLPLRQRAAVVLTIVEDRRIDDVAEILGCGPETARTHVRRAKSALAADLAHLEDDQ